MIIYVQPVLFSYRLAFVNSLSAINKITVLTGPSQEYPTCNTIIINHSWSLRWCFAFLFTLFKNCQDAKLFIPAYSTHIGILSIAIFAKILGIRTFVHGQALFKKPIPSHLDTFLSLFWLFVSYRYISYSQIGIAPPFSSSPKLVVIENRFESLDALSVGSMTPSDIINKRHLSEFGLLFIGRDRPRSELSLLVSVVEQLSLYGINLKLHVIGPTRPNTLITSYYGNLPPSSIPIIAKKCHLGVYPGDAGLSILHYMALGLCTLVHSDARKHSGPEPCHVLHNVTGVHFDRLSPSSLQASIYRLYYDRHLVQELSLNGFNMARQLHKVPYSAEISAVLSQ
jgi:hypothetical protein